MEECTKGNISTIPRPTLIDMGPWVDSQLPPDTRLNLWVYSRKFLGEDWDERNLGE